MSVRRLKMYVKLFMVFVLILSGVCSSDGKIKTHSFDNLDLNNLQYPKYTRATHAPGFFIFPPLTSSIFHLIRSALPTIKKGTSKSRVGFGFAFGDHADFQVTLEVGPDNKEEILDGQMTANTAKRQLAPKAKDKKPRKKVLFQTEGSQYLLDWSQNIENSRKSNSYISSYFRNPKELTNDYFEKNELESRTVSLKVLQDLIKKLRESSKNN